ERDRGLQLGAAGLLGLAVDGLLGAADLLVQGRLLGAVLLAQLLDGGVALLPCGHGQAVAEVALALAGLRRLLVPRARVDRHLLRAIEPVRAGLRGVGGGALRSRRAPHPAAR